MAYCTQADVANAVRGDRRLTQLADWFDTGAPDPDVVLAAIEEASDTLDGYARAHHSVPFAAEDVPRVVRRKIAREAAYLLALDAGMVTPSMETQHVEWLAQQDDIARGRYRLALETDKPKQAAGGETGELKSSTGTFDSPDNEGLW
jgi:phage gp36-like protein